MRELDAEALAALVAGIMLTEIGLRGAGNTEPLNVRQRLLEFGVIADSTQINEAIRKCRRQRLGLVIEVEEQRRGYRPVKVDVWQRPRKRRDEPGETAEPRAS